ncbi:hypothetical protein QTP88_018340 [Uroleucon formosanum]
MAQKRKLTTLSLAEKELSSMIEVTAAYKLGVLIRIIFKAQYIKRYSTHDFYIFKSTIMDEFYYKAACNESLEGNINLKSNISIPIDSCNSYVNHTELLVPDSKCLVINLRRRELRLVFLCVSTYTQSVEIESTSKHRIVLTNKKSKHNITHIN